ncbi:nuclear transport factor 2 family protein [Pseudonocardia sp. CA-107938]|uniref:nuclear transport factor 2 family protein n=1 Tax=Pseudonocardia sp. CA-107938 TaxID=3240021 RepID=UPI003D8F9C0D
MALSAQDRLDITDLISRHGHLCDAGELERMDELFTSDIVLDVHDFGLGTLTGLDAIREASLAMGPANPVGHHVTNIVITGIDDHSARVRSKSLGVHADGTAGSATYDDDVARGADGWRITRRTIRARRTPLGGRTGAGPREVLDRFRTVVLEQSVEGLREVYAADAVQEFPFAFPGVPTRLEGRDAIVDWIAALWASSPLRFTGFRTLALHPTTAPDTIIVEQESLTTGGPAGDVALPNIMVFTARGGQIVHLRDYVNVLAAAEATGRELHAG